MASFFLVEMEMRFGRFHLNNNTRAVNVEDPRSLHPDDMRREKSIFSKCEKQQLTLKSAKGLNELNTVP